jgi:peptidoglycan-N-acetylglucosamine deacetylase
MVDMNGKFGGDCGIYFWTACSTADYRSRGHRVSDSFKSVNTPHPLRDQRWHPSTLVRLSFVAHAAAAGLILVRPTLWPWAASGLLANHALLTASGLLPRSSLLGPNWTQLPANASAGGRIAITFDDGPDPEVTPRVLDVLDQRKIVATFFCIGDRVAAHPALTRDIVRRGHAIENHSRRHPNSFSVLGPRAMAAEIAWTQDIIGSIVGQRPLFFRAPAGLRNPFLDPVLARLALRLASWTRRGFDTVTNRPATVLARLLRDLGSGDILLLHDGHAARTIDGNPVLLEVLPGLLDAIRSKGLTPITLRSAL